jgi:hypothetical protein
MAPKGYKAVKSRRPGTRDRTIPAARKLTKAPGKKDEKRTSLTIPTALWIEVRKLAAMEQSDMRALIIEGLETILAKRGSK